MITDIKLKVYYIGHDKYNEIVKFVESNGNFTYSSNKEPAIEIEKIEALTKRNPTTYSKITFKYKQPMKEDEVEAGKKLFEGLVAILLKEESEVK